MNTRQFFKHRYFIRTCEISHGIENRTPKPKRQVQNLITEQFSSDHKLPFPKASELQDKLTAFSKCLFCAKRQEPVIRVCFVEIRKGFWQKLKPKQVKFILPSRNARD